MIRLFPRFRARLLASRLRRAKLQELSARRSFVADSAHILGWDNVEIGRRCVISDDTWINVNDRSPGQIAIRIGDCTFLGRRNFLSSGTLIDIGPYCLTGVNCHFLGSDHLHGDPFTPYAATGVTSGGNIRLGPNCWLGSSVTVLKGVTIGYGSIIGAASVVTRDVPPFSVVVGSPARVVKRFHLARSEWVTPDQFPGEATLPSEQEYLAKMREKSPLIALPVNAGSRDRGDM